jgi:5S rRNA maturation endonuclease (ribonuclease M5)
MTNTRYDVPLKDLKVKTGLNVLSQKVLRLIIVSEQKLKSISDKGYDIYVLSDPDVAGNHLYEMIKHWCPDIPRLDVDPKECAYFTGKKYKAGIEYSSYTYLKKIICPLIGVNYKPKEYPICWD